MTEGTVSHQERIAFDPQLFRKKIDAVNKLGIVGERRNIGIVLLIADSRLIPIEGQPGPLGGINIGHPGTGKSKVVKESLKLYSNNQVTVLSSTTEAGFYNLGSSLRNKVAFFDEARIFKKEGGITNAVRVVMSEGSATHVRTAWAGGEMCSETAIVEGPIAFISTTNTPKLEGQLADRLIKIRPDSSSAQTARIIKNMGLGAAGECPRLTNQELESWRVFHDSLTSYRVRIPFAPTISDRLAQANLAKSTCRAFSRLLSAITATTVLYQKQRSIDDKGYLIAEICDYAMAYQLMRDCLFEDIMDYNSEPTGRRLSMIRANGRITISELVKLEKVSRQALHSWVTPLENAGVLFWCDSEGCPFINATNLDKAKRRGQAFLTCATTPALPSPYELTDDPAWLEGGDLFELYDLDLEGVNAPVSYEQSGTGVGYEEIPVFTEIPHTTAQNALMLYRPAV